MAQTCQRHNTCKSLASRNASRAAAVAAVMYYRKNLDTWVLGLGLETGGQYKGQYNLCAGKGESGDTCGIGFCWLKCVQREFYEEFGFDAGFGTTFDPFFRGSNGRIRVFIFNRTPVFIAVLPNGTSRKPIKLQMTSRISNPNIPYSFKEMSDFEFIRLDNGQQIEGRSIQISGFADGVRKSIDVNNL